MATYTIVHVVISLVGIGSGFVVLFGFLTAQQLDRWTAVFLATTIATSATGFGFPVDRVLPSHIVGAISLVVLGIAMFARYGRQLAGRWRAVYVVLAVLALYFNVFVGVVQAFSRIPVLRTMAPTQSEPPFVVTQLTVLVVFLALSIAAVLRFRIEPGRSTSTSRMSVSGV